MSRTMFGTVELPVWLFVLILLFAAVTAGSHLLIPPVRWFFRRRMEKAVAKLNERLERPIQPFKLARRHDMIQRLIYDPEVVQAVSERAAQTGVREDVAFAEARRYAREIVPSFSASAYFGIAIRAARWLSTRLYDVRLGNADAAGLAGIDPDATVIFVMNHRSNMDYVLVTYLAAERSALSYAVGEWAQVWPLSRLIRAMGAYFIRRRERNALYRRVLARYVKLATRAGVTQAIFPEGGLSLTGALGEAKLGLLGYITDGFDAHARDVVFVPVALNYDRVIEDRILVEAAARGQRRFRGSFLTGAGFVLRWLWRRVTLRARRFGYASVSFGTPLSLRAFGGGTEALGEELMARIRRAVPILPVPLVASVMQQGRGTGDEIARRAEARAAALRLAGADLWLAEGEVGEAVSAALAMLMLRKLVGKVGETYEIAPGAEALIAFYAASAAMPDGAMHQRGDGAPICTGDA